MPLTCRECREDLDHCHGTVVHHRLSWIECTDDCGAPDGLHSFSIDCEAIGCTCTVVVTAAAAS